MHARGRMSMASSLKSLRTSARTLLRWSVAFLLLAEVADAQYAVPSGITNWWTGDTDGTDRVGAKTIVAQNGATTATGYTLNGFKMGGGSQHWLTSHNSWSLGSTFTIEFWAKLDTTSTQQAFVAADEGPGTTNKWILRYRTSPSRLNFHINGPVVGSHNFEASWSPTAGTWYHICVLRDGTNYKIFVDNTQLGSSTAGPAPPTVSYGLSIGMAENNMYMQGMVDELSVYNRAISHGSGGELSGIFNARQLGKRKFEITVQKLRILPESYLKVTKAEKKFCYLRCNMRRRTREMALALLKLVLALVACRTSVRIHMLLA